MSSLGRPQGHYNTCSPPHPPHTPSHHQNADKKREHSWRGELGWNDLSTCPSSIASVRGQCAFHLCVLSSWRGPVVSDWRRLPGVLLGEEACCGVGMRLRKGPSRAEMRKHLLFFYPRFTERSLVYNTVGVLKRTLCWFNALTRGQMIITIAFSNTCITSPNYCFSFAVRTFKIYSRSNFQAYNMV